MRYWSALATLLLPFAALAQHEMQPGELRQDRETAWLKYLTDLGRQEGISIAFDLPDRRYPLATLDEKGGEFRLKIVGQSALRSFDVVDGVYVFRRRMPDSRRWVASDSRRTMDALASLDAALLERLYKEGVHISELPRDVATDLLLSFPFMADEKMAIAKGKDVVFALDMDMEISIVNPLTGEEKRTFLGDYPGIRKQPDTISKDESFNLTEALGSLTPSPAEGEFDFGEGEILTLREVIERARDAFDAEYFIDNRLYDSQYFFSGKYTKERFEAVLDEITTIVPLVERSQIVEGRDVLEFLDSLEGIIESDKFGQYNSALLALESDSMDSIKLAEKSPGFKEVLQQWGLTGQLFEVMLKPAVLLESYRPSEGSERWQGVGYRIPIQTPPNRTVPPN